MGVHGRLGSTWVLIIYAYAADHVIMMPRI